ncbi:MAG TPA: CAP domain-containing protein [Sporichthyaceae bacterium]|jgi:uncharacterized protein YkwD
MTVLAVVGGAVFLGGPVSRAEASTPVFQTAINALVTTARLAHGCKPLKLNSKLNKSAQSHAKDMSKYDYFTHTSRDGTSWSKRIEKAGFKNPGGENIAYGYPTAASVVQAWLASPGHRRNILDCNFKYIGVGYAAQGAYWVQDFGY